MRMMKIITLLIALTVTVVAPQLGHAETTTKHKVVAIDSTNPTKGKTKHRGAKAAKKHKSVIKPAVPTDTVLAEEAAKPEARVEVTETVTVEEHHEGILSGTHIGYTDVSVVSKTYTDRDLQCLAKNIYYEAGSEPRKGKVAVAQVTLNRVNSGKFADKICGVVYEKSQFSWTRQFGKTSKMPRNSMWDECLEVAEAVLNGDELIPRLSNALYFHSYSIRPRWGRRQIAVIGQQVFYE